MAGVRQNFHISEKTDGHPLNNTKNNNKLQIFSYLELDVEFQIKRIFYLISDFNELEEKSNLTPEWLAEYLRVL